jgi:hypothetical protein
MAVGFPVIYTIALRQRLRLRSSIWGSKTKIFELRNADSLIITGLAIITRSVSRNFSLNIG